MYSVRPDVQRDQRPPLDRLESGADLVTLVLTLFCHGCPLHAIGAGFELDERTVASWPARSGAHCQQVHEHLVEQGQVDLGHVQADEVWVKVVGGKVWMALALVVPSRVWWGGVISPHRDEALIPALMQQVRACARHLGLLVRVAGLASYVTVFKRVFRVAVRTGRRGRPRLELAAGFLLGQVVKRSTKRRVTNVAHRIVITGTAKAIDATLAATGSGTVIKTGDIERLHATFRGALAPLVRRGRAIAHQPAGLTAGMPLVGCADTFCWPHASLQRAAPPGARHKWQVRPPWRPA